MLITQKERKKLRGEILKHLKKIPYLKQGSMFEFILMVDKNQGGGVQKRNSLFQGRGRDLTLSRALKSKRT